MPLISEIIAAVNDFAPLSLQESWDNSGVQVGPVDSMCKGALLCVDVSPKVIDEAKAKGCNLVISHHPLLFKGIKQICPGENLVQQAVWDAISAGITVFSSHTALDSASHGISRRMAEMLGLSSLRPLEQKEDPSTGLGCVGEYQQPIESSEFIERVKRAFRSPVVRCSFKEGLIRRVGLCGGAGGEFIPLALKEGCDAYLTSDVRYHDFVDYGRRIFIADIGHFESEECSKQIFYEIISEKFPNFAVYKSATERNPINYL